MPIAIRYKNMGNPNVVAAALGESHFECVLRPTPFISMSVDMLKTPAGDAFGVTYNIVLTGTILPDEGMPFASGPDGGLFPFHSPGVYGSLGGPYNTFDMGINITKPSKQKVPTNRASQAILMKQRAIRALFADDGQRMEITDQAFGATDIICYPRVKRISFDEGMYINKCTYTIELEADTLWTYGAVDAEGNKDVSNYIIYNSILGTDEDAFLQTLGNAYIKDFSESWSIDTDESGDEISTPFGVVLPRRYTITHNISATGKDHYHPYAGVNLTDTHHGGHIVPSNFVERLSAWDQARKFVEQRLSWEESIVENVIKNYVGPTLWNSLGPNLVTYIMQYYKGFDHQRTEQVDKTGGIYSISDTFVLEYNEQREDTTISVNTSVDSPWVNVSIDGTLLGQSNAANNIAAFGGLDGLTCWENTLARWNRISNNGYFGVGSELYKRCNNVVAVELNSAPTSIAVQTNERDSSITFSLEFDNRPTNYISNTLTENVSVNDTYPGDVFAVIPVIGRATGPIIQYIGGRTEYRRQVIIDLTMDYSNIAYDTNDRASMMLLKPSVTEPQMTEIANVLEKLSPAGEPGVRKYFINPPTESWNPKTGNYNLTMNWIYELEE